MINRFSGVSFFGLVFLFDQNVKEISVDNVIGLSFFVFPQTVFMQHVPREEKSLQLFYHSNTNIMDHSDRK